MLRNQRKRAVQLSGGGHDGGMARDGTRTTLKFKRGHEWRSNLGYNLAHDRSNTDGWNRANPGRPRPHAAQRVRGPLNGYGEHWMETRLQKGGNAED